MTIQNHILPAPEADDMTWLPPGYTEHSDGIYFQPGEDSDPIFVCSPLRVIASFADSSSEGWGQLVAVKDRAGVTQEIRVFNELLDGPQQKVIIPLAKFGLKVGIEPKSKKLLVDLLKLSEPRRQMTSVTQPGWVGDDFRTFSLGRTILGERAVLPLWEPESQPEAAFAVAGTLDSWRTQIGGRCRANPMMILAISLAFSAPLLKILEMDGGGLHFRGLSSSGKSTLLRLAASVWGSPSLVQQWRATDNGLEKQAPSYNDLLLPLDELAAINARHLSTTIYMLSNGKAKTRMSNENGLQKSATRRLAIISSGELSVREHLSLANLEIKEGQEVRLIDIEADTRMYGAFDDIHGASAPGQFAASIQAAASKSFGAVGRSFLEKLIVYSKSTELREPLQSKIAEHQEILLSQVSPVPDSMAGRVAKRFALIGIAGELATKWGLTGWAKGEAKEAVIEAFCDWHDRWVGDDAEAAKGPMGKLREFLTTHAGKLVDAETFAVNQTNPGFLHAENVCLDDDTWRSLFPGSTGQDAARQLAGCRVLIRGDGGHLQRRGPRCIPGRPRFYTIDPKRLEALLPK